MELEAEWDTSGRWWKWRTHTVPSLYYGWTSPRASPWIGFVGGGLRLELVSSFDCVKVSLYLYAWVNAISRFI
jgi:hypothetical protein